jgi:hypothetical protein
MEAIVLELIAYIVWSIMLAGVIILIGVVIAGIVQKTVEDIL